MISFDRERQLEFLITNQLSEIYFNHFTVEMQKSDEIGHSHGPGIQKAVAKILQSVCVTSYELDKKGKKKKRAFSDIILETHPTNIKFGVSVGSPNLVSMNRMIKKINEEFLEQYYVIFVHYDIVTNQIKIRFVNILQFTDCMEYNGGTGQIMIQQSKFNLEYEKYLLGERNVKTYQEIRKDVNSMFLSRMIKHINSKQKQLENIKKKYGI